MNHKLKHLSAVFGGDVGAVKTKLDSAGIWPLRLDPFDIGESIYPIEAAQHLADLRAAEMEELRRERASAAIAKIDEAAAELTHQFRTKFDPVQAFRA